MKISTLAAGVALSALMITGAVASDLNGGSLKDGPFAEVNHVDFSGAYVGVGVGGGFYNTEIDAGSFAFNGIGSDGAVIDGVLGYDFRRGSFVIGPRIIGALTTISTTINGQDLANLDGFVNLGGRAGVVFNRTLVYAHAGYEIMWVSSDIPSFDKALKDADLNAVTAGLGIETVIGDGMTLALEGAYVHGLDDANDVAKVDGGRAMVRLNRHF